MTGKKAIDLVLGIINLVFVGLCVGVFVYTEFISKRPLPSDDAEFTKFIQEMKEETGGETYRLDKITLNLTGRSQRLRFLDVEMYLEPTKPRYLELLSQNKAFLQDTVINIGGAMSPQELNTVTGKILFENRLKKAISEYMGKPMVKKIFFTTFVVQ